MEGGEKISLLRFHSSFLAAHRSPFRSQEGAMRRWEGPLRCQTGTVHGTWERVGGEYPWVDQRPGATHPWREQAAELSGSRQPLALPSAGEGGAKGKRLSREAQNGGRERKACQAKRLMCPQGQGKVGKAE